MTNKLFEEDSYLRSFDANVLKILGCPGGQWGVVLDRTAFYPEKGGQPFDTGFIDNKPVIGVHEQGDEVIHLMEVRPELSSVRGEIRWDRRFDHMQQHTGEHILSALFLELLGANNVGFHIGPVSSQIDLDIPNLPDEVAADIEEKANRMVFENRPVTASIISDTASEQKWRKRLAKQYKVIRLVEVKDCDICPCGGTHVGYTGEIGLIKIRGWERKKGGIRLDYVCGGRALKDYSLKHQITTVMSSLLSAPADEVLKAYEKQAERLNMVQRELAHIRREKNTLLSQALLSAASEFKGVKIVTLVREDLDLGELNELACLVASEEKAVALLATGDPANNKAYLAFACNPNLGLDMGVELREILQALGGKGGGRSHNAQGGCPYTKELAKAINQVVERIQGKLSGYGAKM